MEYQSTPQSPYSQPPPKKFPWVPVIIGVVVLCLLCAAVLVIGGLAKRFLEQSQEKILGATTQTVGAIVDELEPAGQTLEAVAEEADSTATVVDRVEVTATEEAEPTATAEPMSEATPEGGEEAVPKATIAAGDEVLEDDFTTDIGWPSANDEDIDLGVRDGAYYFQIKTPNYYDWAYLPVDFNPQQFSFDVKNLQDPPDGTFGVFCQFQDIENYLYLEATMPDGYMFGQVIDDEHTLLTPTGDADTDWTYTSALNMEVGDINHFDLICTPTRMTLKINGKQMASVDVPQQFANEGEGAFFVYAIDDADEDGFAVEFDNVVLRREPLP